MVSRLASYAALTALLTPSVATGADDPLAPYRWQARPLLVFSPPADERLRTQVAALDAARDGLRERDQLVWIVLPETIEAKVGPAPRVTEAEAAAALRRRFAIGEGDFAVILVGKDGGEKLRQRTPLSVDALFGTIDAMPMRRREMREQ